jgi:hypothetical protein
VPPARAVVARCRPRHPHGRTGLFGQALGQLAVRQHPRLVFPTSNATRRPDRSGRSRRRAAMAPPSGPSRGSLRPVRSVAPGVHQKDADWQAIRDTRSGNSSAAYIALSPPRLCPATTSRSRSAGTPDSATSGSSSSRTASHSPGPHPNSASRSLAGRNTRVTAGISPLATAESNAVMAGCRYSQSSLSSSRTTGPPPPAGWTRTVRRPPSRSLLQRIRVRGTGRTPSAPMAGQCGWAGASGVATMDRSPPAPTGFNGSAYAASPARNW